MPVPTTSFASSFFQCWVIMMINVAFRFFEKVLVTERSCSSNGVYTCAYRQPFNFFCSAGDPGCTAFPFSIVFSSFLARWRAQRAPWGFTGVTGHTYSVVDQVKQPELQRDNCLRLDWFKVGEIGVSRPSQFLRSAAPD